MTIYDPIVSKLQTSSSESTQNFQRKSLETVTGRTNESFDCGPDIIITMHTPVQKDTFYLEETRSNKSRSRTLSSLKDMALKKLLGETEQGFMKKFSMSPSSPKKYSKQSLSTMY